MSNIVISVEGISKKYRLGATIRYDTMRDKIAARCRSILTGKKVEIKRKVEEFWALKDVSFDVRQGEVIGVVGRNGAGKSTLLKIMSRITDPTEGIIRMRGRVSSLLEVGTGFHKELTGRENIYLNGAILGMTKREISAKYDEIVDFAEVGQFIDTPVKRYSSGMYVRLAFAVAAHLEPEILLVDEVLAVGDAGFQKKCLGKMNDVARGGRTILFVSHNMAAVESLCSRSLLLDQGHIVAIGDTQHVLETYFGTIAETSAIIDLVDHPGRVKDYVPVLKTLSFIDKEGNPTATTPLTDDITFRLSGETTTRLTNVTVLIRIYKPSGTPAALCHSGYQYPDTVSLEGPFNIECTMRDCRMMHGPYVIKLFLKSDKGIIDHINDVSFEITPKDVYGTGKLLPMHTGSYVPDVQWRFI
ncbi:ATP-binding cassette domain-containing protein [bacterium]|nr:ATP-binding cassette domain-containing protein [candidate division CSSED10-310 bacterium]